MQKVDVVMCTYNSNKPLFRLVLRRLRDEVPVNNLIVVDKWSHDGTIDVIREIFPDAIIIRSSSNLAYARYLGIKHVETPWFMFLDDDVILLPGWFRAIKRYTRIPNAGGVESTHIYALEIKCSKGHFIQRGKKQVLRLKRSIDSVNAQEIVHKGLFALTRGMLMCTLLKRDVVSDWKPHPNQGSLEDYSITQHVIKKGYLWIVASDAIALHIGWKMPKGVCEEIVAEFKKGMWDGSNTHFVEIPRSKLVLHLIVRLASSLLKRKLQGLAYYFGYIVGYLSSTRYCELKR